MAAISNTDDVVANDRQAVGRQPDNSTPTGGQTPTSGGGGTITAVTAGTGLSGGGSSGSVALAIANVGTAGNYQRATTNAQGQVSAGQNDVFNVRQFGAVGNGVTDDTTAINNAIAACTSYSTLYFPAGKYLITSQPSGFTGLNNLTVCGDGFSSEIFSNVTGAAGNTLVFDSTCSFVTVRDLAIVGSATVRGSGIHIRLYASDSEVRDCYISGCSDFGIHLSNSGSAWSTNQTVTGCIVLNTLGDGIHVGQSTDVLIEDNDVGNAGDDSIAVVADNTTYYPQRVSVLGNRVYNGAVRGIVVLEAFDCLIEGNDVFTTVNSGIEVNRFNSTTAYNTRVKVIGNKVQNSNTTLGPIGAINAYFCQDCTVDGNEVYNPSTGAGIAYLDIQNTSISRNKTFNCPTYGIRGYTFGAAHTASNWSGNFFCNNQIAGTTGNDGMWLVADTGKTLVNTVVDGNVAQSPGSGVFITYQQMTTAKITNNTAISGSYASGGTNSGVTLVNNN